METTTLDTRSLSLAAPATHRPFRTAAVLGAGTMGSQIAAHLADAELEVHLLDITPEAQEQQLNLKYIKNFDEPFELVQCGEFPLAFLMNPTRMSEVRDVANAGEKMPQKSTYFYPKLLTGLVINPIVEGETAE